MSKESIIVVSKDLSVFTSFQETFEDDYNVHHLSSENGASHISNDLISISIDHFIALVVVDVSHSEHSSIIEFLKKEMSWVRTLLVGSEFTHRHVVNAMHSGARDCVELPLDHDHIEKIRILAKESSGAIALDALNVVEDDHSPELITYSKEIVDKLNEVNIDPSKKGTILLVEDEEDNRDMLAVYLEEYKVLQSVDGYDALTTIAKHPEIEVVVLDVRMPRIDGIHVCRFLSRYMPDIKVIMLTAFEDKDVAQQTLSDGAFYYLNKPVEPDQLHTIVSKAFSLRRNSLDKNFTLNLSTRHHFFREYAEAKKTQGIVATNADALIFFPELFFLKETPNEHFDEQLIDLLKVF